MHTDPAAPAVYTSYPPKGRDSHGDWLGETIKWVGATENQMAYLTLQRTQLEEFRESGERKDLWLLLDKRDALMQMQATQLAVKVTNVLDQEGVIEALNARVIAIDQLVMAAGLGARREDGVAEGCTTRESNARTSVATGAGKLDRQIAAILAAIAARGLHAQRVPVGMKSQLRKDVIASSPDLFGAGTWPFYDAWKKASTQGSLSIENRERFTSGR